MVYTKYKGRGSKSHSFVLEKLAATYKNSGSKLISPLTLPCSVVYCCPPYKFALFTSLQNILWRNFFGIQVNFFTTRL